MSKNIKQLSFPAYFRNGNTYSCLLSEKEYIQVKLMRTETRIVRSKNVHEISEILTGNVITEGMFNRAAIAASERIEIYKLYE